MAVPTTRELNVKVISVVTLVAVLLLIAIIYAAQAGFFYFQHRQVAEQYDRGAEAVYNETLTRSDNLDLARLNIRQQADLDEAGPRDLTDPDGEVTGQAQTIKITDAMQQIADRY
jgi:hypothetical protein